LLVVEDIHWADPLTLAHLAQLSATVAQCPALLLLSSRIEGDPLDQAWRAAVAGAALTTIDLGPLRPDEARTIATAILGRDAALVDRCIERAAGNPLFLEQLLRHAVESREDNGVPGSVQSLVQARLDRLEPVDRAALQAASVLGQRFEGKALEHLLGRAAYSPERLVARLLLRAHGAGSFLFVHALVRDAVYDSLLRARRRELHRAAAVWYEGRDSALRAEHLDRAEAPEAAGAYMIAAREQARQYRYETARRLVERGLLLAGEPGDVCALACLKGEILHDLGVMPQARQAYEAALKIAQDDRQRCAALLGLAATLRMLDDFDGALSTLDRAQALASRLGLGRALSHAHHMRGNIYFPMGEIERCAAEHEAALRLAEAENLPEQIARAWGGLGDAAYMRCRMRTAHEHFERCVAISREHGLARVEVANLSMVGHCLCYLHRFDEALAVAREAIALGERVGHKRAMIVALNAVMEVSASRGPSPAARHEVERGLALARELGARRFEANCMMAQALQLLSAGGPESALPVLERALEIARRSGIGFVGPRILALLAAHTGEEVRRKALRAEARALLAAGAPGHNYFWFYRTEIEAALDAGDLEAADEAARSLAARTSAEPLPWSDFWIRTARALVGRARGAPAADVEAELRALLAEAERCGMLAPAQRLRAALGGT
jgi:tetratricopeptide (TPR) repeat protein